MGTRGENQSRLTKNAADKLHPFRVVTAWHTHSIEIVERWEC